MYSLDILIQGFPGKSEDHGGLGWSTVPLLRGHGEVVLIDTGSYSYRVHLLERLGQLGLSREDITSVVCNARTAVLPLYKYLGAFREGTAPSYASGDYYLEDKTPRMLAEEREHYHARTQGLDVQHQFSKLPLDPLGVADKAVRVDVFDGACLGELF
jgi:hypothetical protein